MTRVTIQRAWNGFMWFLVFAFAIAGIVASWGCGGELGEPEPTAEPEFVLEPERDEEEPVTRTQDVAYIPGFGWQSQDTLHNGRCIQNPTNNTHTCNYPPNKNLTVRVTGTGMTASQKAEAEALVDGFFAMFSAEIPSWSMSRVNSGTQDVNISYGTLPQSNKNSIHTYAHADVAGATLLEDFGATGSYQTYGSIACKIDRSKIVADFTTAQRPRVLAHAIHFCVWKGVGFGSSGNATNRSYTIGITPDALKSENIGNRVKCWAETWSPSTNPGQIFPLCGGDLGPCPCASETDN